jgi:hypothetical protein
MVHKLMRLQAQFMTTPEHGVVNSCVAKTQFMGVSPIHHDLPCDMICASCDTAAGA